MNNMAMNGNMIQNNQFLLNQMMNLQQDMNNPLLFNKNINNPMMTNQNMINPMMPSPNIINPMMPNQNIMNSMMINQNMINPMIPNQNIMNPMLPNQNIMNQMMINQNIMNPMMLNFNMNNPFQNNMAKNNKILNNQSKIKQILNQENNLDLNLMDKNRKNLIYSIIKFYKNNGLNNMDFHIMSQIKLLNKQLGPIFKGFETFNEENKFNYIKNNKMVVNFVNSDYTIIKTKIPYLITKSELYSVAEKFKCLSRTNILLIHSEKILENDESSIEEISEGDFIIIIESRYYQDNEYFISLKEKHIQNNDKKMNILLIDKTIVSLEEIPENISLFGLSNNSKIWKRSLILSANMLFFELLESIYLIFGSDPKDLRIIGSDGGFVNLKKDKLMERIGKIFRDGEKLSIYNSGIPETSCDLLGKEIIAIAGDKIQIKVGRLNSTNVLFCLDHGFRQFKKDLKSVIINNKIIKDGDDESFYSLGINNNFECVLK